MTKILILLQIIPLIFGKTLQNDNTDDVNSDSDYEQWKIVVINQTVPHDFIDSSWGRLIVVPFRYKRHIVKIEPYIETGHEHLIQRMFIYRCPKLESENPIIRNSTPDDTHEHKIRSCNHLLMSWFANGPKNSLTLPPNVGLPMGDDTEKYLFFEIIYNNKEYLKDINDSSGFTLYIAKSLRQYDAGLMAIGSVPDFRFFIPPKLQQWSVVGHCYSECLKNKLPNDGITVIDMINHGHHQLLNHLTVKHNRNGKSFMFSDDLSHGNKFIVKPEDEMTIECTFDSSLQDKTILGGLSWRNENCLIWLLYYPKIANLNACLSSYSLATIMSITGIEQLEEQWNSDNEFDIIIKSPPTLSGHGLKDYLTSKIDWNNHQGIQYLALNNKQQSQCNWIRNIFDVLDNK